MINLLGKGFIGSEFADRYDVVVNERNDTNPKTNKILYFISTVDNYNLYTDPHLDIETNLNLLIDVLENARRIFGNDFEFNFISSWFVYGKTEIPAKEDSVCNPTGFYSITKRCAEQLLISYCTTYKIHYRILRMSNVIGINDQKVSKKKNALQYMIQQLVRGEDVNLYEGKILRDLIDVRDAADAIYRVIQDGNLDELFNIGNGIGYSFEELIYKVHNYLGTGSIKRIPQPEFHKLVQIKDFYLDVSKLHSIGFQSRYDVEKSVMEIADYYRENL